MGTSVRGSQLWFVAGDEITATIDKIGTLRHKVEAAPAHQRARDRICRRFRPSASRAGAAAGK